MQRIAFYTSILLAGLFFLAQIHEAESSPLNPRDEMRDGIEDEIQIKINRQYLLDLISNLEQDLMSRREHFESQKRGFDFGIGRGYSGAEMAKHKLGLAAASNPWGPGRRKRSFENLLPNA